jgi:hypothetical protein
MKVEELPSYGTAFDHMPLRAAILEMKVMFSELKREIGLFGIAGFIRQVYGKQKQLKKQYGDIVNERFADVPSSAIMEMYLMSAMYLVLTEREGKEKAFEFVKGIFRKIGPAAHEAFYDIKDLVKCPGDIYTNFCQLNRSMFESSARKGFYKLEGLKESENLQYFRFTKCLNIDVMSTLGCPELARLGCIADVAGYAPEAMGNKVNLDFRRPYTMANGDKACEFYYYRKGHAPADMRTL